MATSTDPNEQDGRKLRRSVTQVRKASIDLSRSLRGKAYWARLTPEERAARQVQMHAANKRPGRTPGIYDGYTREQSRKLWLEARELAEKTVKEMIEKNIVELPDDASDAARAEEAMVHTIAVMRAPSNAELRLRAARQVLEWTKAKPESKSKVTVQSAEDFLAAALAEANGK